jgi:hypothetical protein
MMVDAGRLTFFGATQDGEFTVGRRRAETAVGGGPYESSTAGQAMITYSHHSIFDMASPGRGKEARLTRSTCAQNGPPGRESEALIFFLPFLRVHPIADGRGSAGGAG